MKKTHNNGVDSIRRNSEGENDEIPNVTIVNAPLEYRSRVWTFFGFKAVDGITMKNTFICRTCHIELSYNQTKQYDCSHETKARGRSEFLWVLRSFESNGGGGCRRLQCQIPHKRKNYGKNEIHSVFFIRNQFIRNRVSNRTLSKKLRAQIMKS